jgi:hypothetical protein
MLCDPVESDRILDASLSRSEVASPSLLRASNQLYLNASAERLLGPLSFVRLYQAMVRFELR